MLLAWKWPLILTACTCTACILYLEMDASTVAWFGVKICIKLVLIGGFFHTILRRIRSENTQGAQNENTSNHEESFRQRTEQIRKETQEKHDQKARSYMERILIPREEAKRRKKEEEFQRFTGPAWKGKGDVVGGEDERGARGPIENPGEESREIRKLPESVQLHIPNTEPIRKRRVIQLPPEPSDDIENVTIVILRSPIGVNHRRGFLSSCKLQVVFDYMTTLGFKEKLYTLATTYPRQQLTDRVDLTLQELGFYSRIVVFDYMTTLGFKEKLYTLATTYPRQQLTDRVDLTLQELGFYSRIVLNIEEIE